MSNPPGKEAEWMPDWAIGIYQHQLDFFEKLCKMTTGNVYVDVGCFIGCFTKVIAKVAKERRGMVFSIDQFKEATESHIEMALKTDTMGLLKL